MNTGHMPTLEADATPVPGLSRGEHLAFLGVFVAALILRLIYLVGQARHNPLFPWPTSDEILHDEWARQIAHGEGMGTMPYFRAPLYYYMLGVVYWLAGPSVVVGRVVGCVIGAASCYLIARLGRTVAGFWTGLVAGAIAVVYWPMIYFDTELLSVGLEILLAVALLWLVFVGGRRASTAAMIGAGVVLGLGALTRPNILAFAPAIVIWYWLEAPAGRAWRTTIRGALLTGVTALVVILPVSIRNYVVGGEPVFIASNGGVNFCIGNNAQADGLTARLPGRGMAWGGTFDETRKIAEAALGRRLTAREVSAFWYKTAWNWIKNAPLSWGRLMFQKFRLFWMPHELPNNKPISFFIRLAGVSVLFWVGFPVVVALAAGGAVMASQRKRDWFLFGAFLLIYMVTVVAFFCPARYRLPVVPALILFAAFGLCRAIRTIASGNRGILFPYLAVSIGVGIIMIGALSKRDIVLANDAAHGHRLLAHFYMQETPDRKPDYAKAIENLREAARVDPNPSTPYSRLELAQLLARVGRTDEAEKQLRQAVSDFPGDVASHLEYASFLEKQEQYRAAVRQCRRALGLQPENRQALLLLAIALAKMGNDADANQAFAALRTHYDGNPQGLGALAEGLAVAGRIEDARELGRQAMDLARQTDRPELAEKIQRDLQARLSEEQIDE